MLHLPETNPYASKRKSEPAWLWDEIKKGKFSPDKLTLMGEDGSMAITMLLKAFEIISSPMHPDNNWRSVVETMSVGKNIYYRLATHIPIPVMEYWKKHGHPPAHGWDFFDPNASLVGKSSGQPPPAPKTPAKKAKPVPEQAPAKTPKQLAEEELSKVIKTAKVGSPEYKIAIAKRDAMRTLDIVRERAKKGPKS